MDIQLLKKLLKDKGIIIDGKHCERLASDAIKKLKNMDLTDKVISVTEYLPTDTDIKVRLRYILSNITTDTIPKCAVCGAIIPIRKQTSHKFNYSWFSATCSQKCNNSYDINKQKRKQGMLKKYGVENPSQSLEIQQKKKQTIIERYGTKHPLQSPEIQEKQKQTNLERYGVEHPSQLLEIREKMKLTNLERYGVENVSKSPEIQEKQKQTNLERYGVEHPWQSQEIREKIKQTLLTNYGVINVSQASEIQEKKKQTMMERYGVENASKSPEIKEKIKQTNLERYGVEYSSQKHLSQETVNKLNDKQWLEDQHITQKKPHTEIATNLGCSPKTVSNACFKFNIPTHYYFQSAGEKQVVEYLRSITDTEILTNDRSLIVPHELDIVIPEFKLAIEYDGIYWHSELAGKDKNYHLNKSKLTNQQGYHLVHLYDIEWEQQQDVVKSRLASFVHVNKTIYARKCKTIELTNCEQKTFFDCVHVQRGVNAQHAYGLVYNDRLVAVMSFGKSRFNKNYQWELLRYANALNTSVIGGASRLFKHFIKNHNPTSIISYSDKRWNKGGLYDTLGFRHLRRSKPNYRYFNSPYQLYSRNIFQKHKLKDKLEIFDPNLTEWENMQLNGYNRIWDCGNDVWGLVL